MILHLDCGEVLKSFETTNVQRTFTTTNNNKNGFFIYFLIQDINGITVSSLFLYVFRMFFCS